MRHWRGRSALKSSCCFRISEDHNNSSDSPHRKEDREGERMGKVRGKWREKRGDRGAGRAAAGDPRPAAPMRPVAGSVQTSSRLPRRPQRERPKPGDDGILLAASPHRLGSLKFKFLTSFLEHSKLTAYGSQNVQFT